MTTRRSTFLVFALLPAVASAGAIPSRLCGHAYRPNSMDPRMREPCVALAIRFDAPGCYASGSKLGTRGEAITFTRASTQACGVLTCQVNEMCVTGAGADLPVGARLSVANPLGDSDTGFCVAATASSSGSGAIVAGTKTAGSLGGWTLYFLSTTTVRLFVNDATSLWKAGQKGVANVTTERRYVGCATSAGVLSMAVDGAGPGTQNAGSGGSGIIGAQPGPIYLGNNANANVPVPVTIRNLKVCKHSSAAYCQ